MCYPCSLLPFEIVAGHSRTRSFARCSGALQGKQAAATKAGGRRVSGKKKRAAANKATKAATQAERKKCGSHPSSLPPKQSIRGVHAC